MELNHNWRKNTSWTLLNPAEIVSFLKTGADLTVSVLSHVCGSRFREITLCALKASVLSQALTQCSGHSIGYVLPSEAKRYRDIGESWWRHQMETFSALPALCAGNSPVPVKSPHKGQWRGALMFSLIYAWINDWVNNREAGDLRRQRGHYDVIVMWDGKVKWSILRLSALYLRISALTHWGRDKMAAFFRTTFSKAFSSMKMYTF